MTTTTTEIGKDVTVRIPTVLRKFTDGKDAVAVSGDTVIAAIRDLTSRFPDLATHLFDNDDNLRSFVNLYLNEEDVRYLKGEQTPISGGDELAVIPAVAGGK